MVLFLVAAAAFCLHNEVTTWTRIFSSTVGGGRQSHIKKTQLKTEEERDGEQE